MSTQREAEEALIKKAAVQDSQGRGKADCLNRLKRVDRTLVHTWLNIAHDDGRQIGQRENGNFSGICHSLGDLAARHHRRLVGRRFRGIRSIVTWHGRDVGGCRREVMCACLGCKSRLTHQQQHRCYERDDGPR